MEDQIAQSDKEFSLPEIYTRDLSFDEFFSTSWMQYKKHFLKIMLLILLSYVPAIVISYFLPIREFTAGMNDLDTLRVRTSIEGALNGLFGLIALLGIIMMVKNDIDRNPLKISYVIGHSFRLWPRALFTGLLTAVFLIGPFLLFIIPGIILIVYWSFIVHNTVVYQRTGYQMIRHSHQIVKGRWWKLFGYYMLLWVIVMIINLIITSPQFFIEAENLGLNLLFGLTANIVAAFSNVFFAVVFVNFDRELQANNLLKIHGIDLEEEHSETVQSTG